MPKYVDLSANVMISMEEAILTKPAAEQEADSACGAEET